MIKKLNDLIKVLLLLWFIYYFGIHFVLPLAGYIDTIIIPMIQPLLFIGMVITFLYKALISSFKELFKRNKT